MSGLEAGRSPGTNVAMEPISSDPTYLLWKPAAGFGGCGLWLHPRSGPRSSQERAPGAGLTGLMVLKL